MTEAKQATFPRRDADGRVVALPDLLGAALAALVMAGGILLAIDVMFSLFGWGRFGSVSGWLAGILAVWLYVEDFRAWRGVRGRIGMLLVAGGIAAALAFGVATATRDLRPLLSGAAAVAIGTLAYAPLWFFGIRLLARAAGEKGNDR